MTLTSDFEDLLRVYYKRLFPYEPYIKWLNGGAQGTTNALSKREFSFTLQDDIYIRYLSFQSADQLKAEMVKRLPHKIDIGAIFNADPRDHQKVVNFQPLEKELVFDIDMTDYDDIRTCCSGAAICNKCWQFITLALKVLDRALREDFGFKHLLWVYSGRRGIHCWVSDPEARRLGQSARSAVAEYLQLLTGGDSKVKKINLKGNAHPSIEKSLEIVRKWFRKLCLEDQDILGDEKRWNKVLALIPLENLRKQIEARAMAAGKDSVDRWERMEAIVKKEGPIGKRYLDEIMLQFSYPRLDINVSKGLNHLLKSPFCVHPKTGRVCVPIDPFKVEHFDPMAVPTISQLTEEVDKFAKEEGEKKVKAEYKKTSLREPMTVFEQFLSGLAETAKGKKIALSDSTLEF